MVLFPHLQRASYPSHCFPPRGESQRLRCTLPTLGESCGAIPVPSAPAGQESAFWIYSRNGKWVQRLGGCGTSLVYITIGLALRVQNRCKLPVLPSESSCNSSSAVPGPRREIQIRERTGPSASGPAHPGDCGIAGPPASMAQTYRIRNKSYGKKRIGIRESACDYRVNNNNKIWENQVTACFGIIFG